MSLIRLPFPLCPSSSQLDIKTEPPLWVYSGSQRGSFWKTSRIMLYVHCLCHEAGTHHTFQLRSQHGAAHQSTIGNGNCSHCDGMWAHMVTIGKATTTRDKAERGGKLKRAVPGKSWGTNSWYCSRQKCHPFPRLGHAGAGSRRSAGQTQMQELNGSTVSPSYF